MLRSGALTGEDDDGAVVGALRARVVAEGRVRGELETFAGVALPAGRVLEATDQAVVVTNPARSVVFWNAAAEAL